VVNNQIKLLKGCRGEKISRKWWKVGVAGAAVWGSNLEDLSSEEM